MVHNLLQERCLTVTVVGISDLLGSENRSRFLRAASPLIALHLRGSALRGISLTSIVPEPAAPKSLLGHVSGLFLE